MVRLVFCQFNFNITSDEEEEQEEEGASMLYKPSREIKFNFFFKSTQFWTKSVFLKASKRSSIGKTTFICIYPWCHQTVDWKEVTELKKISSGNAALTWAMSSCLLHLTESSSLGSDWGKFSIQSWRSVQIKSFSFSHSWESASRSMISFSSMWNFLPPRVWEKWWGRNKG